MKKIYILFVLIFFAVFIQSQKALDKKTISLFNIEQANLELIQYKWGNEFVLQVHGKAHKILDNTFILISIWYQNKCIRRRDIFIKAKDNDSQITFFLKWDPINNAYENVLAGEYLIKLEFHLNHQNYSIKQTHYHLMMIMSITFHKTLMS